MSRLRTLLAFFAAAPEQQIAALADLPRNRGAPDFFVSLQRNPLLTLVRGLGEEAAHHDWEPWEDFLERTQLPEEGAGGALSELLCYAWLLLQSPEAESYWTQKALERKTEWKLFRRLAGQALVDFCWAGELFAQQLSDLVVYYQEAER